MPTSSLLCAALLLTTLAASAGTGAEPAPALLLITIDTLRADHCSAYGYARETTPNLTALAADGVRFASAYAPMATTGPSHATLFTSLLPASHGVLKNGLGLGPAPRTLAERLRARGFRTGAVVSSYPLDRRFGFARGFESYDDAFSADTSTLHLDSWEGMPVTGGFDWRADTTTDRALAWLDALEAGAPFFLWVHYFDPHDPYEPPAAFAERFRAASEPLCWLPAQVAAYDAEIAFADQEMGRLLDGLAERGLAGGTLVVVAGDHGEGLLDHDYLHHGLQLYDEAVRVPLVLRLPSGERSPRVVRRPVGLVDVEPTILDLLQLPGEREGMQGTSLVPLLAGARDGGAARPLLLQRRSYAPGTVVSELAVKGEKWALREGRFKLIDAPEEGTRELYDLVLDPGERHDLAAARPETAARLARALADARAQLPAPETPAIAPSEEDVERLRSLGYVR